MLIYSVGCSAISEYELRIKSLFVPKFLVFRMIIMGSETVFGLILSGKKRFPTKRIYQLSISDVKMLHSPGILGKHTQFVTFFV